MGWTFRFVGGLLAGLLGLSVLAAEPAEPLDAERLRELLEEVRVKHDLPAFGAAVVRSEGEPLVAVVGVRRRDKEAAAQDDDLFHLGSDTKSWTAWLIAWLCERGLLDWDTPLARVFPELADKMTDEWKQVTVGHLLTHRAGLPANLPGGWWRVPRNLPVKEQRLFVLRKTIAQPLEAAPGEKYIYSNLGYVLAGAVSERVGKASWEDQLQKQLFTPLKMKRVGFGPVGEAGKLDQPRAHTDKGEPREPALQVDNPPVMRPAGGIHCSLGEWSRFVADQLRGARGGKALLQPDSYQKLHSAPPGKPFYTYGGWAGLGRPDRPASYLTHDGSNTLNYCTAILLPEQDLAILVVTNQGGDKSRDACYEAREKIRKAVLGQ